MTAASFWGSPVGSLLVLGLVFSAVFLVITMLLGRRERRRRESALVLPTSLVREADKSAPWVLVLREGRAQRVSVQLGLSGVGRSEILKGLAEGDLVIAPPGAVGSAWMKRFARAETGFASGWMTLRGVRRRKGYDRGFVVSDHADWADLVRTVHETGASRVLATHGNTSVLVRYLREMGVDAQALQTRFGGEEGNDA